MSQIPLYYGPDLDQAWSRNAGVCRYMTNFVPTQRGAYATVGVGTVNYLGTATMNTQPLIGYMFRQVSGSLRLLMFNTTSIDEYDNAGTRTSRGTGYSASTTGWSAASRGNEVIAVNYYDAPQVSTSAGFSTLGGSPPKARHITVQSNFVMLADTDDGTNQYGDQVWWSGQGNSATWAPDLSTQAGNIRLVGAPGPIRCLVNFRDYVVAFKDDATFIGQNTGNYIWTWRLASNRIGCVSQHGAVEYGGVLYFLHRSGAYSFDGSQFVNIGYPIMQTLLNNVLATPSSGPAIIVDANAVAGDIRLTQAVTDDIDGVVLFAPMCSSGSNAKRSVCFTYNTSRRKWGSHKMLSAASQNVNGDQVAFIKCTNADITSFSALQTAARFIYVSTDSTVIKCYQINYPAADGNGCRIMTGVVGSTDQSTHTTRMQFRMATETGTLITPSTMTVIPYTTEGQRGYVADVSGTWNATFSSVDFNSRSRFWKIDTVWGSGLGGNNVMEIVSAEFPPYSRP